MAPTHPVLLLHGQPGSARDWDSVVARLDGRVNAIAIDRPGWTANGSGGIARAASPAGLASGLEGNMSAAIAELDARGVERATVVGHSFGGAVATSFALEHRERVAALVLLAPAVTAESLVPLDHLLAARVIGPIVAIAGLAGSGLALSAAPVRTRIAGSLALDERYLRRASRMLLTPSSWRSFVVEQRALLREVPRLERRLGEIDIPTMIVSGADDRVVPPVAARALSRRIERAELVMVADTGHLLAQTAPSEVARTIIAACERSQRASTAST